MKLATILKILCVALILRVLAVFFYVPLFNQDELTILYDAISVVETGMDRWKSPSPFFYKSLGISEYRPPLMFWLQILGYKFFHINEYGARLIAVIFGIIGLVYSYLIALRVFNKTVAEIVLVVLTLAPVHILFGSMSFESTTLSSSIFLISIYYFICYYQTNKFLYLALATFFCTLDIYTYPSYKLSSALLMMSYLWILLRRKEYTYLIMSGCISLIIASPQIYTFYSFPKEFLARAAYNVHFKHKVIEIVLRFFECPLISLFDLPTWFMRLDSNVHNINIRYLLVELPFYMMGFFVLFSRKAFKEKSYLIFFIVLYFISAAPEGITFSAFNLFRNNLLIYFVGFIISLGIYHYYEHKKWIYSLIIINFILYFILGYHLNSRHENFQNNLVEMYKKLDIYDDKAQQVYIERMGNQQYVYLLYYCKIPPKYFQTTTIKNSYFDNGFDDMHQIGKYYFKEKDIISDSLIPKNTVVLTKQRLLKKPIDSFQDCYYYQY